jgi:hypothetical protein
MSGRIAPTHYTIYTIWHDAASLHLKSQLVETSADPESLEEMAYDRAVICAGIS